MFPFDKISDSASLIDLELYRYVFNYIITY